MTFFNTANQVSLCGLSALTISNCYPLEDVTRRDNKTVITVARESDYQVSLDSKAENIYVYPGAENTLRITRVYSTKWLCSYNMLFYPFDTQVRI